jgi:phosphoribosylpyrophosphate synthetase
MAVYGMKVFAGNSNLGLSKDICEILEIPLDKATYFLLTCWTLIHLK